MTPQTLQEFRQRLLIGEDSLTPRLREVRRYVLERPQSVALDTVAEIAAQAEVPPSTLVRFAHEYGFDGFSAMQKLFKAHLHDHYGDYGDRIRKLRDTRRDADAGSALAFLQELAAAQRDALTRLPETLDAARLDAVVSLLNSASSVHICGVRRAFPVVAYLTYSLARLGLRCHAIDGIGAMHREQAAAIAHDDVLIAITYAPYAATVREIIASARDRHARIILLTDDDGAPSSVAADAVLAVRDAETGDFRSLDSSLCLAQALCLAVGYRRGAVSDTLVPGGSPA